MGRTVAVVWHASFSVAAGVLYFFFVLPRTYELLGDTSHTLGTVLRIVTGALIGLAALPVVFTLLRTRRPEFGVPQLALRLRTVSAVLHVLAGVLIIGAAVAEIWLSLDSAGQWLFGIYGAAAAIALLAILAFYLAFVAELPPPAPKPVKVKERAPRRRRGRKDAKAANTEDTDTDTQDIEDTDDTEPAEDTEDTEPAESDEVADEPVAAPVSESESESESEPDSEPDGKLANKRPTGKGTLLGRRGRTRGGVALED
jgi:hypothetical protein